MKIGIWKKVPLLLIGVILLGAGCISDLPQQSNNLVSTVSTCTDGATYNSILERCPTNKELSVQALLPANSLVREIKPLTTYTGGSQAYVGIYIENPIKNVKISGDDYTSCPEERVGQSITGTYHVFTYEAGTITSDRVLPATSYGYINNFPLKNTKLNNFRFFGGSSTTKSEANNLMETSLINLKDYTADGVPNEFILYGNYQACGHYENIVVGYDDVIKSVVFYPVIADGQQTLWNDNFIPDRHGSVSQEWICGDHGSDTNTRNSFTFNHGLGAYLITSHVILPCIDSQPQNQINATAPNGTYNNTAGNEVPRPYRASTAPAGATAQCNDGTYSFSQSRRGTCSHHGGVAIWF